jgi:hypothetical protein
MSLEEVKAAVWLAGLVLAEQPAIVFGTLEPAIDWTGFRLEDVDELPAAFEFSSSRFGHRVFLVTIKELATDLAHLEAIADAEL